MSQQRTDLFEHMERNYEKIVARQVMEPIEIPELKDETGVPKWFIKEPPGWAMACYAQYDMGTSQVLYACGMIVTHAHDMFGEPIFYENKVNGVEVPLAMRLATLESSRDRLATTFGDENIIEVFRRLVDIKKQMAKEEVTPTDVKTQSSAETLT